MTDFIIRRNAETDPSYAPYCGRCDGLLRMRKVAPFYWTHSCGAEHDERTTEERLAQIESRYAPDSMFGNVTALVRADVVWLAEQLRASAVHSAQPAKEETSRSAPAGDGVSDEERRCPSCEKMVTRLWEHCEEYGCADCVIRTLEMENEGLRRRTSESAGRAQDSEAGR